MYLLNEWINGATKLSLGHMALRAIQGLSKKFRWGRNLALGALWPSHWEWRGNICDNLKSSFIHTFNFFSYWSCSPKGHEMIAKCSIIIERRKKYIGAHFQNIIPYNNENEFPLYATTQMTITNIMLSARSQTQKNLCKTAFICKVQK